MPDTPPYTELLRPRFHFTARRNWLNDPNGLVYFGGEYHLFFQYNPRGINWGYLSWGHAVSTDLVRWTQLPDAIDPDDRHGWIWSGSAVVDWNNTSGLGSGNEPPLIAIYTAGDLAKGLPVQQFIAYSHDRGRTFTKFEGNPVIPHIEAENRDPKVIWHEPTRRWVMALYLARNDFALFASPNLREWTRLQTFPVPGNTECPDLFALPIDGDPKRTAWVFWAGGGLYMLGSFDGSTFQPTGGPQPAEFGPHGYAAQTWSDTPDRRRVQISWMRGGQYPYMPFNQQMSIPVELSLRTLPEGVRLCREPVNEVESLWGAAQRWRDHALRPGEILRPEAGGGLYDLALTLDPRVCEAFRVRIHGHELLYRPRHAKVSLLGKELPLPLLDGRLELRLLIDRTSIELFARRGAISGSFCFLPAAWDHPLEISADGGEARLIDLTVHEVNDAWASPR